MKGVGFLRNVWKELPHLSLGSSLRYVRMMAGRGGETVHLHPRHHPGLSFDIRAAGSDRWTFREIFVHEVYREVVEQVGHARRFVDLGANIGLASLYFLEKFPEAQGLAVEANPATFAMLERNLAGECAKGRASLFLGAAWSRDGAVAGDDGGSPDGFSRFSVRPVPEATADGAGLIPARRVETLLDAQGWDRVDLIKIDIEGAEIELFRGGADWLERTRCVAMEFHDDSARQCDWPAVLARHGMRNVTLADAHTAIGIRD
jgi:FkbM family methyltransferase